MNSALVTLAAEDKTQVPNSDFVLYIRDEMVNKPAGLVKTGPNGS